VSAPTAAVSSKAIDGSVPAIVLPTRLADTQWATFLVRQQDRDGNGRLDTQELSISADSRSLLDGDNDGQLTADELAGWRRLKADLVCRVRLDDGQSTTALIEHATNVSVAADNQDDVCLSVEPLQFVLRPAEGALGKLIPLRKKRYETRFTDADTNQDGALTVDEVSKRDLSELKYLLNSADRDGNGQLSKLELSAWLDLQEQLARGHILLTLYDYGTGLFEFLDADHNGGLSARELRIAWQRVREAGCIQEGAFDATALPHLCLASISRGHPLSAVALPRRDGPTWFLSMDRNSDGDVSAREFLGSSAEFRMLDTDGDGLLSANEARLGDISRSASAK
jgi:Ca2+-binding EF-hand superfamily protein